MPQHSHSGKHTLTPAGLHIEYTLTPAGLHIKTRSDAWNHQQRVGSLGAPGFGIALTLSQLQMSADWATQYL